MDPHEDELNLVFDFACFRTLVTSGVCSSMKLGNIACQRSKKLSSSRKALVTGGQARDLPLQKILTCRGAYSLSDLRFHNIVAEQ